MAVPRPVVVVSSVAVLHDRALGVSGFTGTEELAVLVDVDLEGNRILVPRVVGAVGDLTDDLQRLAGVHLGDDFTANRTVRVGAVNRSTWRQVAVATVHQCNVPVGAVATEERSQCGCLAGQTFGRAVPRLRVGLERRHVVVIHAGVVERRLVEQRRPVTEGAVAVVDRRVVVVDGTQTVKDEGPLDVHAVHDANGERFSSVAVEVRERPFVGQFGRNPSNDLNVAGRQTRVRVVVPYDVAVAVQDHVVLLGQIVPGDFFVATGDLAHAVVGRGVPLHLLPRAADTEVLDEGQRRPSGGVGSVAVVAQTGEVGRGRQVAEQAAEDGESDRRIFDAIVKQSAVPIGGVMRLEVEPERLLIAAEVRPCRIVNRHVGFSAHKVGLGLVTVEHEHLRDLGVDPIGRVVANRQILRVEELPHAKVAGSVGQNVDGLNGGRVVGRPLDVHLNRELRCRLDHAGNRVQPVNVPCKDGGALCVQPEVVWKVQRDVGWCFVVGVENAIVVVVPIGGEVGVFNDVKVNVGARVVVVVVVDGVGAGGGVGRVGNALAVTKVVVIPRVGGIAIEACGPEQDFVFVVHAVLVIVLVKIVSCAVVVVVERCRDADCQFDGVGNAVAVPVVVSPVQDTVVVVVKRGLLLAPETAGELFLVDVHAPVVIVIRVFTVRNAVVVVVNVVQTGRTQTLRHDALVPDRLVEAVVVGVGVVAVVVVVDAVCTAEEVPVVLAGVVVKVEVAVHLEEIPNAVVVVIHVKPVKDGVVIVVQVDGGVGEITVDVTVNVVLEEVSPQFIGEVRLGTVVAVPLPDA